MRQLTATLLCGTTIFVAAAFAQNARPSFEVISIKPNVSGSRASGENSQHGRLTIVNDTVKELVQLAYGVKDFQVTGGPGWLESARYDIVATTGTGDDLSDERLGPLLQSLLEDRFGLRAHRETKESTVYSLVVTKGGPKMAVDNGGGESSSNTNSKSGTTTMIVEKITTTMLASRLERFVDRRVIDHTGLTAAYDFTLTWAQDQVIDPTGPPLFTALQEQLGLKLDSTKGSVDILVIDSLQRPSEN